MPDGESKLTPKKPYGLGYEFDGCGCSEGHVGPGDETPTVPVPIPRPLDIEDFPDDPDDL